MNNLGGQLQMMFGVGLVVIYMIYVQIAKRPVKAAKYVVLPVVLIYSASQAIGDMKNINSLFSIG
ncbi:MAG: hypothetical protein Q8936_17290, partial [Bacillota bacterium]|nr:hypothetical protein [Bacillota bacterium]